MSASIVGGLMQPASLVDFLARAGVTRSSTIRVTGPSALSALLWLCRHGYDQVGYVRAEAGSPHEAEPDAIIVAHTCGELELKRLLAFGRHVRPGGVFLFRLRTGPGASTAGLEWMLKQAGLSVEARLDGERRALVIARRAAVAVRQAA
jgi:hypothetical protein